MSVGIQINNLSKEFHSSEKTITPLDSVSFEIPPGKMTAILGKSGTGKTTLLKLICGLEEKDSGEILFSGLNGKNPSFSYVFQDPRLLPWKTVKENIQLAIRTLPKEEQDRKIKDVLKLVRLPGVEDYYPSQLSGGMAQRVGLARGLIANPDILLLDEPFSALDFITRSQLQQDFSAIQRNLNTTIVLITHDINEAILLSDKVVYLDKGKIRKEWMIDVPHPRRVGETDLSFYQNQLCQFILK